MTPRLRTKTGCLLCRQRRIKCDERKPVCTACRRNNLRCLWASKAQSSGIVLRQKAIREAISSLLAESCSYMTSYSDDQGSPVYAISAGYPPILSAKEHRYLTEVANFVNVAPWNQNLRVHDRLKGYEITIALTEPWVRDALYAISTILAVSTGQAVIGDAEQYYTAARRETDQRVLRATHRSDKESVFVAISFQLYFEALRPYQSEQRDWRGHILCGLWNDLNLEMKTGNHLGTAEVFFNRAIEAMMHHETSRLFFGLSDRARFQLYKRRIRMPSGPSINQMLRMDLNVYQILGRACCSQSDAEIGELNSWLMEMHHTYSRCDDPSNQSSNEFDSTTRLAIAVLRILTKKAQDPAVNPSHPEIRSLVKTALAELDSMKFDGTEGVYMTWMLCILLCATDQPVEFRSILTTFMRIQSRTTRNEVRSVLALLRALNSDRGLTGKTSIGETGEAVVQPADTLRFLFCFPAPGPLATGVYSDPLGTRLNPHSRITDVSNS